MIKFERTICPGCGKKVGKKFIVLNTGALRRDGPNSASIDPFLVGFFHLQWHGHEIMARPSIEIDENSVPGQIELLFHDADCLQKWFAGIVERLAG